MVLKKSVGFLFFFLFYFWFPAKSQVVVVSFEEATASTQNRLNSVPTSPLATIFPTYINENGEEIPYPVKVLKKGQRDFVQAVLHGDSIVNWSQIEFYYGSQKMNPKVISATSVYLSFQNPQKEKEITAFYKGTVVGKLGTLVLEPKRQKVIIVPLIRQELDQQLLFSQLRKIYQSAHIQLDLQLEKPFRTRVFHPTTVFSLGDTLLPRYTGQMRLLRDQYFLANPNADRKAFYLFLIPAFSDSSTLGFMVQNKSIGVVPYQKNIAQMSTQLARTLAFGMGGLENSWRIGAEKGSSFNLMDTLYGQELYFFQLEALHRENTSYSRIDAYENIRTSNGTVGYYFWEEDEKGNILYKGSDFLNGIERPFKKNYIAYRFNVKYTLLKPLFKMGKYYISILNFIFVFGLLFLPFFIRKKLKRYWIKKNWPPFFMRSIFWASLFVSIYLTVQSFSWGNDLLDNFKVVGGPLPELYGLNSKEAKKKLFNDATFRKQGEISMGSELLIKRQLNWKVRKVKRVLYFDVLEQASGQQPRVRYTSSSDYLTLRSEKLKARARNHYVVFSTKNRQGEVLSQKVYTYDKQRLEKIDEQIDIPRRILLFASGYRPTSSGPTFAESFAGIQSNGLEYKNSTNYIYNFDRYDYWERWNEINLQFQNKINPSATFYADGHFSVATSDYGSLLNFTHISQAYPKRCRNPKKHTCYSVKNDSFTRFLIPKSRTIDLLKRKPNTEGFAYRKRKGEIAGMNLLQELNLYPNLSQNDTLFIVAHSMGYAYSLGMIKVLRGKINFGGFYIVAPENAKSGYVNANEWKEVWQYGSRFNLEKQDAPCLQDGVAPQSAAKGLPYLNRAFIPSENYNQKGFFDSHFVGYYTWVLAIPEGEKGHVKQR